MVLRPQATDKTSTHDHFPHRHRRRKALARIRFVLVALPAGSNSILKNGCLPNQRAQSLRLACRNGRRQRSAERSAERRAVLSFVASIMLAAAARQTYRTWSGAPIPWGRPYFDRGGRQADARGAVHGLLAASGKY